MKFEDNVNAFLKELACFEYDLSVTDLVWNVIFPGTQKHWHRVNVVKYQETFYISISGKSRMFQAKITRLSDSRTHLTPVLPEAPMIATFMVLISIISFNFFWAA